jgi:hypothetical protein
MRKARRKTAVAATRLDAELVSALRKVARARGQTLSEVLQEAARQWVDRFLDVVEVAGVRR